jgi:hypothetical protein
VNATLPSEFAPEVTSASMAAPNFGRSTLTLTVFETEYPVIREAELPLRSAAYCGSTEN